MKCRGCGEDTNTKGIGGDPMHVECEYRRLDGLREEADSIMSDLLVENEQLVARVCELEAKLCELREAGTKLLTEGLSGDELCVMVATTNVTLAELRSWRERGDRVEAARMVMRAAIAAGEGE